MNLQVGVGFKTVKSKVQLFLWFHDDKLAKVEMVPVSMVTNELSVNLRTFLTLNYVL